jgi:hypothetical protein
MSRKTQVGIALGALALIWALVLIPRGDAPSAPPSPADEDEDEVAAYPAPEAAEPPELPEEPEEPAQPQERPEPDRPAAALEPDPDLGPPNVMGPISEMRKAYKEDTRDPDARATEQRVQDAFLREDVPQEMLRSVSCVKSVCKLELLWSPENQPFYMIGMMNMINHISQKVSAEPVGGDLGRGQYRVEVFVSRIEPPFTPPA